MSLNLKEAKNLVENIVHTASNGSIFDAIREVRVAFRELEKENEAKIRKLEEEILDMKKELIHCSQLVDTMTLSGD